MHTQQTSRSGRKPIAGYRSKTDAVADMTARGMRAPQIAAALGITESSVGAYLANVRRRKRPRMFGIDHTILDKLEPHAKQRGIATSELIRRLIRRIAADGLVDAVMDDREADHD